MIAYSTEVLNDTNSSPKGRCLHQCLYFEYQVLGVDPTDEKSPVIYLPVTLSYK